MLLAFGGTYFRSIQGEVEGFRGLKGLELYTLGVRRR